MVGFTAIGGGAAVAAACAVSSAILTLRFWTRTLRGQPHISIDRCGVSAGGGECTPRSQGRVGGSFGVGPGTPNTVLKPLGTVWEGGVSFPFPRDWMRGRRWRWSRGVVDGGLGSQRRVWLSSGLEAGGNVEWTRCRECGRVCKFNIATPALRHLRNLKNIGVIWWRVGLVVCFVLIRVPMVFTSHALSNGILDAVASRAIFVTREQPSWNLLLKALVLLVRITDRHLQHDLPKSLKFLVRTCLDEKCHPSLKASRRQAWYVRSFVVSFLYKMMLAFEVPIHSWYWWAFAVEQGYIIVSAVRSFVSARRQIYTRPRIPFLRQFDILVIFCHLCWRYDNTVLRIILLNLYLTQSALQDIPALGLTQCDAYGMHSQPPQELAQLEGRATFFIKEWTPYPLQRCNPFARGESRWTFWSNAAFCTRYTALAWGRRRLPPTESAGHLLARSTSWRWLRHGMVRVVREVLWRGRNVDSVWHVGWFAQRRWMVIEEQAAATGGGGGRGEFKSGEIGISPSIPAV